MELLVVIARVTGSLAAITTALLVSTRAVSRVAEVFVSSGTLERYASAGSKLVSAISWLLTCASFWLTTVFALRAAQ
tara:strand:- start:114 stop:344 length:231 start_codon:yes stop_codon:yes gene_type:complete